MWSSTWPPGNAAGAAGACSRRSRPPCPAAEAVHVVNNNAAALVLAATALAAGREIIVSRGELIEIGDGFRLPDLLESTGARIREVGTTNRTTAADYAAAVGPQTAFVLKVHPSNYRIEGFTASASVAELAALSVPVVGDIGSGLLAPHPLLPAEPDASTWLRAGAALVTASGDKLLGGPQAGLLLGRADLVASAGAASAGQGAAGGQADGRGAGGDADRPAAAGGRAAHGRSGQTHRAGRPDLRGAGQPADRVPASSRPRRPWAAAARRA